MPTERFNESLTTKLLDRTENFVLTIIAIALGRVSGSTTWIKHSLTLLRCREWSNPRPSHRYPRQHTPGHDDYGNRLYRDAIAEDSLPKSGALPDRRNHRCHQTHATHHRTEYPNVQLGGIP